MVEYTLIAGVVPTSRQIVVFQNHSLQHLLLGRVRGQHAISPEERRYYLIPVHRSVLPAPASQAEGAANFMAPAPYGTGSIQTCAAPGKAVYCIGTHLELKSSTL